MGNRPISHILGNRVYEQKKFTLRGDFPVFGKSADFPGNRVCILRIDPISQLLGNRVYEKKNFTHRADFPVFGKSGLRNFLHKDDLLKFRKSADFPFFGKSAFSGSRKSNFFTSIF